MRHNQSTKLQNLMRRYSFGGNIEEFTTFLKEIIKVLPIDPADVRGVAWRYYILDESAKKSESGKVEKSDVLFYAHLQIARGCIDSILGLSIKQLEYLADEKRKGIY